MPDTDNPNPGDGGERPSDEYGQSVNDAANGAYNKWDEEEHGISEADRTVWGPELQRIATHEGTNVRNGINTLVQQHIAKRYGSPQHRRDAVGAEMDFYQINPPPETPAPPPQVVDEFGDLVGQPEDQSPENEFLAANPIARVPHIHAGMLRVAEDMVRQGYQPDLPTMLRITIEQADAEVKRAKAASVQVSGAGNVAPKGQSDDLGDILDELTPRE